MTDDLRPVGLRKMVLEHPDMNPVDIARTLIHQQPDPLAKAPMLVLLDLLEMMGAREVFDTRRSAPPLASDQPTPGHDASLTPASSHQPVDDVANQAKAFDAHPDEKPTSTAQIDPLQPGATQEGETQKLPDGEKWSDQHPLDRLSQP